MRRVICLELFSSSFIVVTSGKVLVHPYFVTGGWRKLHNEQFHNLYPSPDVIRMREAGHVARMVEMINAYKTLVDNPEGKRPFGRSMRRLKDNIKMDLKEVGWEAVNWILVA
jgi:hypothetical protein